MRLQERASAVMSWAMFQLSGFRSESRSLEKRNFCQQSCLALNLVLASGHCALGAKLRWLHVLRPQSVGFSRRSPRVSEAKRVQAADHDQRDVINEIPFGAKIAANEVRTTLQGAEFQSRQAALEAKLIKP